MKSSCVGHFTCSEKVQLLLATEGFLEIWQEEGGADLTLVHNQPLQAGAAFLAPFHVPDWLPNQRNGLVAISESGDFQLLHWDESAQRFQELCHMPNAFPSDTTPPCGSTRASKVVTLGSALCCLKAGRDGKLAFALVERGAKAPIRYTATFHEVSPALCERHNGPLSSPLEVLSLSFLRDRNGQPQSDLHGRLLLAQLSKTLGLDGASVSLTVSALDSKTGELQQCWRIGGLENATRVMLTLPGTATEKHGRLLLLSDSEAIAYDHEGRVSKRIAYVLEGRLSAAALLNTSTLVIGDSVGGLLAVNLSLPHPVPRHLLLRQADVAAAGVQALHAVSQSDVSTPTVLCVRENRQASLIRLSSTDGECIVKHVPSHSLFPVHDVAIVHPWSQESVLLLAHGRGRHGSLTRVQESAELTVEERPAIERDGSEVPALVPFFLPADVSRAYAAVILSYEGTSKIFYKDESATWQPLAASGFDEAHRTLAAGSTEVVSLIVQVTSAGVRLVDALPPYSLHQEEAASGKVTRGLQLADVQGSRVAAAGMNQLLTFQIDGAKIRTLSNRMCENQISAVSFSISDERRASNGAASSSLRVASFENIGPQKETKIGAESRKFRENESAEKIFLAIGYWTSHEVEVLSWPELQVVTRVALGDADLPRSLRLVSVGSVNTLLVGTAEGSVIGYGARGEAFHTGPSWHVRVGLAPVTFSTFRSRTPKRVQTEQQRATNGRERGKTDKLLKGRGASDVISIYANSDSGLLFTFEPTPEGSPKVHSARIHGSEGLHHVAALGGDTCLVVSQDGGVKEASLDHSLQARRRTFSLGVCPLLVASHVPTGCLVAACASKQNAHSLRVFHAQTLAQLAELELSAYHVPTCLQSAVLPLQKPGPFSDVKKALVVLLSTRIVDGSAQSVLSVFDIVERPAGEGQVEFRLFLLGAYPAESVILSLAPVETERNTGESTGDETNCEEVACANDGLSSLPMLAVGLQDGLQVVSIQVDPTGEGHVAALEEGILKEAMGGLYDSGSEDAVDICLEESCRMERSSEESVSKDWGLLKVRVEAEVKLTGAVTSLSGKGNVLWACLADKSLLVYEVLQTSTGVQLCARARADLDSPPAAVEALSKERALVGTHQKVRVLERNLEAEAAYAECERIAAVRLSETRGVDLTEVGTGPPGSVGSPGLSKDARLPSLEGTGPKYSAQKPIVGFARVFRNQACDTKDDSNKMSHIAVFADGSMEPMLVTSL